MSFASSHPLSGRQLIQAVWLDSNAICFFMVELSSDNSYRLHSKSKTKAFFNRRKSVWDNRVGLEASSLT